MAIIITRTAWIDDDGTGTTGTVLNNAVKTDLYNQIDGALAKAAQLTGGNSFTGNQTINGLLTVNASGAHVITGPTITSFSVVCTNAATANWATLTVGNNVAADLFSVFSFSSGYASSGDTNANGSTIRQSGAGGLILNCTNAAGVLRCFTNNTERMRIDATGIVIVNATASLGGGGCQFNVAADAALHNGIAIQNTNGGINTMYFMLFYNAANGSAGIIAQTSATTVNYSTSSDARLKDDAGRATDLSALRGVVVHDFRWKADGIRDRGVFAQEAHDLYPRAVTEGTDERTAGGDLKHPWMTDYSKFVPDLIVGWQHHDAELADLHALLATLKGFPNA